MPSNTSGNESLASPHGEAKCSAGKASLVPAIGFNDKSMASEGLEDGQCASHGVITDDAAKEYFRRSVSCLTSVRHERYHVEHLVKHPDWHLQNLTCHVCSPLASSTVFTVKVTVFKFESSGLSHLILDFMVFVHTIADSCKNTH